jgi:hypothetical protein
MTGPRASSDAAVLHRIIDGDRTGYIFKADNNQSTGPTRPAGDQLIGTVVPHIAHGGSTRVDHMWFGYGGAWLVSSRGFIR